ncbi:hypothetical protein [Agromyces sp. NPDC060279]|uniref:hypothetical protein n=1 Tax=Agromyces sp. NPDC060279 TaxID=3347092 RepID=UPI003649F5FD
MATQGIPPAADLMAFVEQIGSEIDEREAYELRADLASSFAALFGVSVQAIRLARAFGVLRGSGFGREGFVAARAAFEHAVIAQWCLHTAGGLDRLRVETHRDMRNYYGEMGRWLGDDELLERVAEVDEFAGQKGMKRFSQIMDDFEEGDFLKISYMNLSRVTHVTSETVTAFHLPQPDDERAVTTNPAAKVDTQGAYIAAASAMLAADVIGELVDDTDLLGRLDKLSDELRIPMSLREAIPKAKRAPHPHGRD